MGTGGRPCRRSTHGCNTVWTWENAGYPSGTSMNGGDEGSKHACYIGYLDHLC